MTWNVIETSDRLHVVPVGDQRAHMLAADCWCGPTPDVGAILVHHSADQRERCEADEDAHRRLDA